MPSDGSHLFLSLTLIGITAVIIIVLVLNGMIWMESKKSSNPTSSEKKIKDISIFATILSAIGVIVAGLTWMALIHYNNEVRGQIHNLINT